MDEKTKKLIKEIEDSEPDDGVFTESIEEDKKDDTNK